MEQIDAVEEQMVEARKIRKSAVTSANQTDHVPDHVDLTSNHNSDDLTEDNDDN